MHVKSLKERIVLHIGLFCGEMTSFLGTEFFLKRLGINIREVADIRYRGEGWPGICRILLRGGKELKLPFFGGFWTWGVFFFLPLRCSFCTDVTSELADISCGDAWLPEIKKTDRLGTSIIIARSEFGKQVLTDASRKGYIRLKRIDPRKVVEAQFGAFVFKKYDIGARFQLLKRLGIPTPDYEREIHSSSLFSYLRAMALYAGMLTATYRLWPLIRLYINIRSLLRSSANSSS